jgi:hypothetical protein
MNQELVDFQYFKKSQLYKIDFLTGMIDTHAVRDARIFKNVGSKNEDGYIRIWCNNKLRMKHRLIYFLYHNELPKEGEELDHFNSIRDHNYISNLQILTKSKNNTACANRKFGKQFTEELIHFVCKLLSMTYLSDTAIAEETGVSRGTVRDIKVRRSRQSIAQNYSWLHREY